MKVYIFVSWIVIILFVFLEKCLELTITMTKKEKEKEVSRHYRFELHALFLA